MEHTSNKYFYLMIASIFTFYFHYYMINPDLATNFAKIDLIGSLMLLSLVDNG